MTRRPLEQASEGSFHNAYSPRRAAVRFDHEVVAFRLAREVYGLDITHLREVIRPLPVAELPRVPAYLLGVATLRGVVVPIVDLRRRLGLPCAPAGRDTRVLVTAVGGDPLGLLVDAVHGVLRLRNEHIEATPAVGGPNSELLAGVARKDGEMIILLQPGPLAVWRDA